MELALVEIKKTTDPQPAAFHEAGARKYLNINRQDFLHLVHSGIILFTTHANGKKRLYLKSDLDKYLDSRPRSTMALRECSKPALKGVGK